MKSLTGRFVAGLLVMATAALLAACGSGGSGDSSTTASSEGSTGASGSGSASASGGGDYRTRALAVGSEFADCARDHGAPGFPDPAIQNGVLAFPDVSKADLDALGSACREIGLRLPQPPPQPAQRPSDEVFALRMEYARCARQNGVPEWPDPRRDGSDEFRGTELGRMGYLASLGLGGPVPQRFIEARNACERIERELGSVQQREQSGG